MATILKRLQCSAKLDELPEIVDVISIGESLDPDDCFSLEIPKSFNNKKAIKEYRILCQPRNFTDDGDQISAISSVSSSTASDEMLSSKQAESVDNMKSTNPSVDDVNNGDMTPIPVAVNSDKQFKKETASGSHSFTETLCTGILTVDHCSQENSVVANSKGDDADDSFLSHMLTCLPACFAPRIDKVAVLEKIQDDPVVDVQQVRADDAVVEPVDDAQAPRESSRGKKQRSKNKEERKPMLAFLRRKRPKADLFV